MFHMRLKANQLFLNITAIHQQSGLLQDAFRFSRQPELRRCGSESLDVSTHDLPIQRQTLAATSLEIERKLQVPSRQLLLQQAAELHFQHVAIRRKTEVNVKEAMIHRFQRQSKPKFRADLPLYLRKSRHGAERHSSKFRLAVFRLPIENQ